MVRLRPLLAPLGLLIAAACANPSSTPPGSTSGSGPTVYEGNVFVLEEQDRDPAVCFGAVADSLPPQCGGIPIVGWDWSAVEGEESASSTTWGSFHVVGTYDGRTFEMQEAGPPTTERSDRDPVDTPCPEPEGGWMSPDVAKALDRDLVDLIRAVGEEPDFAGFWIDYVEEPSGEEVVEPGGIIANVAFTGDPDSHATMIRELWGGPLCLVRHERTYDELRRMQQELSDGVADELGLEVTGSGVSQHDNVVEVGVVVADPEAVAAVEARYGPGAVLLDPTLEPVAA